MYVTAWDAPVTMSHQYVLQLNGWRRYHMFYNYILYIQLEELEAFKFASMKIGFPIGLRLRNIDPTGNAFEFLKTHETYCKTDKTCWTCPTGHLADFCWIVHFCSSFKTTLRQNKSPTQAGTCSAYFVILQQKTWQNVLLTDQKLLCQVKGWTRWTLSVKFWSWL